MELGECEIEDVLDGVKTFRGDEHSSLFEYPLPQKIDHEHEVVLVRLAIAAEGLENMVARLQTPGLRGIFGKDLLLQCFVQRSPFGLIASRSVFRILPR